MQLRSCIQMAHLCYDIAWVLAGVGHSPVMMCFFQPGPAACLKILVGVSQMPKNDVLEGWCFNERNFQRINNNEAKNPKCALTSWIPSLSRTLPIILSCHKNRITKTSVEILFNTSLNDAPSMLEPRSSQTTLNSEQRPSELPKLLMKAKVVLCSAPSCKSLATSTRNQAADHEGRKALPVGGSTTKNQGGTSNLSDEKIGNPL